MRRVYKIINLMVAHITDARMTIVTRRERLYELGGL